MQMQVMVKKMTQLMNKTIKRINIVRRKVMCPPHNDGIVGTIDNQYVIIKCKKCGRTIWEKQPYRRK